MSRFVINVYARGSRKTTYATSSKCDAVRLFDRAVQCNPTSKVVLYENKPYRMVMVDMYDYNLEMARWYEQMNCLCHA